VTADQIIKELMEEKGSAAKGKGPRSDAGSGRGVLMATIGSVAAVALGVYFWAEGVYFWPHPLAPALLTAILAAILAFLIFKMFGTSVGPGVLIATIGSVAAVAVAAYFSSEIGKIALLLGMFALVMIMIVLVEGAESGGGYTIPPEYMAGTLPDPRYTADDHQDDEDD